MNSENERWAKATAEKLMNKTRIVAERNKHKIPYTTQNGVFDDMAEKDINWWTNGFWGGMMWQMYQATGEEPFFKIARENEEKLDQNLMSYQGMDHDSGFKFLLTAVADYRLTGNEKSRNRGLLAAGNLAGRFNTAGKFIRAWNDDGDGSKAGWAIIDCMMNLPLLYWAYTETKDDRFLQIAKAHADTAMKYFVRPDGSVNHIVAFDPVTGRVIETLGGQGYGVGSSWTRGQAWALYGFVISYIHTHKEEYLHTAKRVADYFVANIPENGLIPVDFRQPQEPGWEDSTAAAIASCGLLEIAESVAEAESHVYENAAVQMLKALEKNRCSWDDTTDHILEKCTAAYHDEKHEFAIIYGDYYFIEAIWKLTGKEMFMW